MSQITIDVNDAAYGCLKTMSDQAHVTPEFLMRMCAEYVAGAAAIQIEEGPDDQTAYIAVCIPSGDEIAAGWNMPRWPNFTPMAADWTLSDANGGNEGRERD